MKFQEIRKYFYCEGCQTLEETQEEWLSFEKLKIQLDIEQGNLFLLTLLWAGGHAVGDLQSSLPCSVTL